MHDHEDSLDNDPIVRVLRADARSLQPDMTRARAQLARGRADRAAHRRWGVPPLIQVLAAAALVMAIVGGPSVLHLLRPPTGVSTTAADRPAPSTTVPPPRTESVSFTIPTKNAAVPSRFTMRGTANVSPGHDLWVLIRPPDGTYYTTTDRPIPVNAAGAWSSRVRVGQGAGDVGSVYDLLAVLTPRTGTIQQRIYTRPSGQYSARFDAIPQDAAVHARVGIQLAVAN